MWVLVEMLYVFESFVVTPYTAINSRNATQLCETKHEVVHQLIWRSNDSANP